MRLLLALLFMTISLFGADCADQYNSKNYVTASEYFGDLVNGKFEKYFGKNAKEFKKFKKREIQGEVYYLLPGSFLKKKDNYYPVKNGIWKLHANQKGKIDEIFLAQKRLYQDPTEDLANELNDDMGNFWIKFDGDAYGHYMVPEYLQINYKDFYISLKATIYGSKDDSTGLKSAFVDFYIINNTDEVKKFLQCMKER